MRQNNLYKGNTQVCIQMDNLSNTELENIKNRVEKLSFAQQLEVLKIFVKNEITINENRTGIRLNLKYLYENKRETFDELMELIEQIEKQEQIFNEVEKEKEKITNQYFSSTPTHVE